MKSKNKCLVILSGGQDSTTCLYWAKEHFDEVHAITFDYGQRHQVEIDAAIKVAQLADIASHSIIKIPDCLESVSPLISNNRLDEYSNIDEQKNQERANTFVPMRNALFLTIAANKAESLGVESLVTGVNQSDTGGYDDCRDIFISAAADYINKALGHDRTGGLITIDTPLQYMSKSQTIELALKLDGCMNALRFSHTCYAGEYPPCGVCHSCVLRAEGFNQANITDPIFNR